MGEDGPAGWWARRGRRRASERGSVLVEAVVIIPLILFLTFGAIEYGIAFRESAAVKASTRAGVRTASAMPRNAGYLDAAVNAVTDALGDANKSTPQELWIYRASTGSGRPSSCSNDCALYTWNGTKFVLTGGDPWLAEEQNACASADDPDLPQQIGVYVKARHTMITKFFGTAQTLTSNSIMRLEPYVGTGGCS